MDWPLGWSGVETSQAWTSGTADLFAWGLLGILLFMVPVLVLLSGATRRRRFWCAESGRDVEVEFEERGFPGLRRAVVKSCSAFDPPGALICRRRCLDPGYQRPWQPTIGFGPVK